MAVQKKAPPSKKAPPPAKKATPPKQAPPPEPELQDEGLDIEDAFSTIDQSLEEAFGNTPQQGVRWNPPPGDYEMEFVADETGQCGKVGVQQPKDDDDNTPPYPRVTFNLKIVAADPDHLIDTEFPWTLWLKPGIDKRTKKPTVMNGGQIKALYNKAYGTEEDPEPCPGLKEAIQTLLDNLGGTRWTVRVSAGQKDFVNYSFIEMLQSA